MTSNLDAVTTGVNPGLTAQTLLNPAYSIYTGAVPNVSHEASTYAGQTTFANWSPFASANPEILAAGGAETQGRMPSLPRSTAWIAGWAE